MRFDDQAMGGEAPRDSGNDEASGARIQLAMNLTQPSASAPVSGNAARVMPGPDGIIALPPGAGLDDVRVVGRDLVVTLPDGTQWIIVDGAVFVPQLVINNVQIPPANLAALLIGQEPQPAAGPPQSSGGNFAIPVGGIGDPFDLGDLLPPTDLSFGTPQREEVYYPFPNDDPDVIVITPDNPAGAGSATASVSEAGLPARGNEPPGSDAAANSETTTGSIVITSGDPPFTVTINGVAVTAVGQVFTTPIGDLTITSISNGAIGYSYTLRDNTSGDNTSDIFAIVVTDRDGDTAPGTLTINIVDDVPTARADTDSVAPDSDSTTGNVITGQGTDSGTAGADTPGADGAALSGVRSGTTGTFTAIGAEGVTIAGQFGTLVIAVDGSYTYTKNADVPGGSADVFTYQLTDGDGDTSTATLTITNPDNPVSLAVPEAGAAGTIVFEAGLPAGSDPDADSESASGTITFSAPDGPATVTINGVAVTGVGQVIQVPGGSLTVTSIAADAIGYTYMLADNFLTDPAQVSIPVTVTDSDGDTASANLVIDIVDDVPTAQDDAASPAEDAAVVIDVFANDISGADGVDPADDVALGTAPTKGSVVYNGDGTFTYTPTPGEEGTDSFTYTITDGDGDVSTATVTITLAADSTPTIDVGAANSVAEAGLDFGSDPDADSEFATGTFTITTGNDTVGLVVINSIDVTNGGTVTGAFGTLTVTVTGGVYGYSYELTANTDGDTTFDQFEVVVTDSDGDVVSDTLVIDIVDDVPTARNDTDSVTEDGPLVADGNVLDNDTAGADGASVTAVAFGDADGSVGEPLAGAYGTLTLNADGSYSYALDNGNSIVQALSPGESLTEIFTYTISDGDGDDATATLTITIDGTDDGVTINGLDADGAELIVNEDDLADGSSPDAAALTQSGTFTIETPDGLADVTVDGTNVVSNGVFTPGLTVTSATGILTITGFAPVLAADGTTIIGGTFSYSYLLTDNTTDHALSGEDSVTDSFAVVVTDSDGSSANATLDVEIIDDVPAAADEPLQSIAEAGTVTGTFDFTAGADGATVTAINGIALVFGADGFSQEIDVGDGTIKVKADGSYEFTADASVAGTGAASGTFTVTDGDGDTATADFSFTVIDANAPTGGTTNAAVDDDGLLGGNPASTAGDLDANAGDDPADTSEASFTGILDLDFGGDGPGSVDFAAMDGLNAMIGQENVTFGWDAGTNTLTATGPRDALFTVEITDPTTGAFKVTLLDNVLHEAGGDENDAFAALTYTVTDSDGSTATGTLNITFDDDAPTVTADGAAPPTLTVDESDFSTDATASFASVFAPVFGADGAATTDSVTYALGINAGATGLVDTATGQAVVLVLNGNVVEGRTEGSDDLVFTLSVDAAGNVTLDQSRAVVHSPDTGPDQPASLAADNLVTLTATVTDGDGDAATATVNLGGNLVFRDDAPTARDDAFAQSDENATVSGNVLADNGSGADVFGADGQGASTVVLVPGSLASTDAAGPGTLVFNADGTFTYTPAPGEEGTVTFDYIITDGDGDTSTATVTITLAADSEPSIDVGAANSVAEAGLSFGSDPDADSEFATGTFTIATGNDTIGSVVINGTDVTNGGTVAGAFGTLTVTVTAGVYGYSYELTANTSGDATSESFNVTVTDSDGDTASGTLVIDIVDDVPTARDDVALPVEDTAVVIDVFANDTSGADGVDLANDVALGTAPTKGSVVYNGDGTFTYTPTPGEEGTDSFTYTITDGDGDTSTATVTITLAADSEPSIDVGAANSVAEAGLSFGSDPDADSEFATGTFTIATGNDTIGSVVINGTDVTNGGIVTGAFGTLIVTFAAGVYSYSYELTDNTSGDDTSDSFNVVVTDSDGDVASDTLVIDIVDDVPTARDDANSVGESSYGPVTGDVLANDTQGADGAAVSGVSSDNNGASDTIADGNGDFELVGEYGTLTLNVDGSYSYVRAAGTPGGVTETFTYTLTDGDGDPSTAKLVITIDDAVPVVGANAVVQLDDDALPGGNPGGVGDDPDAVNTSGTLSGAGGDGPLTFAFQTSGAPDGFTYEASGSDILVRQGGTLVLTVTLNAATGAYTVTQNAPIAHEPGGDENNQFFTLSYTVTDADNDSFPGSLTIDVDDDTSILGAFEDATIINAVGSTDGTFAYSAGADGFGGFNITGPALDGITYATVQTAAGTILTATADPDGPGGNPPVTVFQLTVRSDGTYTFELVTPDAATTETVSLLGLNAGGPEPFIETPDGRIEFTSPGGVNSSTQGFGVGNQFVGNGEQFTMEFHTVGTPGNDDPSLNPDFIDAITLVNNSINGSLTIRWTATNTQTGETETGTIPVSGTSTEIDPTISFNVLLIEGIGGSGQGVRFASVDISRTVLPNDLDLNFLISAVDGDGDVTGTSTLNVFIDAGTPPVTLDLDGDGLEFLPLSHGVAFDYDGDGVPEATAWVGPDDGLLVHDANGDGIVNDGSEIVFSINGSTDLEGLRLRFDSNGDGKLTAEDAAFASFGVWQDANSNGVTDPGELRSLSDLGIVSIDLTAGGGAYTTASGSVLVSGETYFMRSDGSQGTVGDAAFATSAGRAADEAQRAAAQSVANQALASSLVAAGLVATIGAAAPAHAVVAEQDSFSVGDMTQDNDVLLSRPRDETRDTVDDSLAPADHGTDAGSISARHGGSLGDTPIFDARIDAGAEIMSALPQGDARAASLLTDQTDLLDMSAIPAIPDAVGSGAGEAAFAAAMMAGPQLGAVLADVLDAAPPHGDINSLLSGLPHGAEAMPGQMIAIGGMENGLFADLSAQLMHQTVDLGFASHDAVMSTVHS